MRRLCLLLLLFTGSAPADDRGHEHVDEQADIQADIQANVQADVQLEKYGSDDPQPIYEAIDEASIGRVFLTPAERRWLDGARAEPERVSAEVDAPAGAAAGQDDRAAGFIRVPGKAPQVFRRGRFVPADPSSLSSAWQLSTDSSSGVVIVRHGDSAATSPADTTEARRP